MHKKCTYSRKLREPSGGCFGRQQLLLQLLIFPGFKPLQQLQSLRFGVVGCVEPNEWLGKHECKRCSEGPYVGRLHSVTLTSKQFGRRIVVLILSRSFRVFCTLNLSCFLTCADAKSHNFACDAAAAPGNPTRTFSGFMSMNMMRLSWRYLNTSSIWNKIVNFCSGSSLQVDSSSGKMTLINQFHIDPHGRWKLDCMNDGHHMVVTKDSQPMQFSQCLSLNFV